MILVHLNLNVRCVRDNLSYYYNMTDDSNTGQASIPKGSIETDNSKINEMSGLLELSSLLPAGSEPYLLAKKLAGLPTLPDRFNKAFLEHGWVLVEFACGYEPAEQALAMHAEGKGQPEIDEFLAAKLLNVDRIKWQAIKLLGGGMAEPINPVRAQFTERVFQAYEDEDYLIVVPLVLMLIDGFSVSATGTKSIFSDLANRDDLFQSFESVAGHPSALKALLPYLAKGQKGYSETPLTIPQRNGILHGTRLNYANKVVAAKVLCLLAAVVEWGRDVAPEPNSDVNRQVWNGRFLKANLARLKADSPDKALELINSALAKRKYTDVVALIDYHPTTTLLSEVIKEWRELDGVKITIECHSEWTVFGTSTDSEQRARCEVRLHVTSEEGIETSSERTLFATRTSELAKAGLPSVWQIGLGILGGIRNQLETSNS